MGVIMESYILVGFALTFLAAAVLYVSLKNSRNQKRKNLEKEDQERDVELIIYKREMNRLEEQLKRKEISKDTYERLRKNLEEQHQKNMAQISRSRVI